MAEKKFPISIEPNQSLKKEGIKASRKEKFCITMYGSNGTGIEIFLKRIRYFPKFTRWSGLRMYQPCRGEGKEPARVRPAMSA
jgi:hypothetical protein